MITSIPSNYSTKKKTGVITGIYKIESPTGKIYIGQSIDIYLRWQIHARSIKIKKHTPVIRSLIKHGVQKHVFSIICELPKDCGKEILNRYEVFYVAQYRAAGMTMLNASEAGAGGSGTATLETLKKLSDSHKGNKGYWTGKKLSPEHREKLRQSHLGHKNTPEQIAKMVAKNTGRKRTPEQCLKMSAALKGKAGPRKGVHKCPDERKRKISEANKGHIVSQETRGKIRETLKGVYAERPCWNIGRKHTEATKQKFREGRLNYLKKQKKQLSLDYAA